MEVIDIIKVELSKTNLPKEYLVASLVDEHWLKLTGLSDSDKHLEQEFPDEVLNIIEQFKLDYNTFCESWNTIQE